MHFNPNEAREIIMKHYMFPENKTLDFEEDNIITTYSQTCSDKLELSVKFENNILVQAKFNGHGCSVFLASTDILLNVVKQKSKKEIQELISLYEKFLNNNNELSDEELKAINDLWVFFNVKKHLSRMSCALLSSKIILNEIK
ncbi:iron-sulfur cluster assembly scaffold protein [Mycoplasmopsis cynos]|uniref:iron-sulfur cluster assembly scaffold protein n=1 Tax=Mycoplasmopsis cynos TaxID=171284 RepID=UPI002AFF93B2|nr:iron-sulfur cluster assembly scaffold protein [Mycoplasmopsis cynos]WQQ17815.1 iron-sulfur cluster assembly scaffold protein [Mycoplasmopsis cynos]